MGRAEPVAAGRAAFALAARVAAVALLASCGDTRTDPRLEQPRMQHQVEVLTQAIGARPYNSPGARRAAEHITAELERLGWTVEHVPVGHIIHPPLEVLGRRVFPSMHVDVNDPNLLVRIPPADAARAGDPAMLLMAHYDTVPDTPGAVDNAASVALLLELARILASHPPPGPVYLAWTAAEEVRLSGATRLAEAIGPRVGVAISLDLVGASDVVTLNGLSTLIGRPWLTRLAAAARASGDVRAPPIYRVASRRLPETERSDHGAFTARDIPAFHLYSRGARRIYLPYHSPLDTAAEIDWRGVTTAGTFVLALIENDRPLPAAGGDAGWWLELPGGPRVLPVASLIAVEALLALIAVGGLVVMARRHLAALRADASARRRLHARGLLGFVVTYALAWLGAGAVLAVDRGAEDHPAPWLHAPGAAYLALVLIAAGIALPLAWLAARMTPHDPATPPVGGAIVAPTGRGGADRFLAAAIVALLLGTAPLLLLMPEVALRPLVSAALLGGAALFTRARFALPLAAVAALLPPMALLDPALAREGFFHDFLGADFPVVVALALALAPASLVLVWAWRRWGRPLPRRGRLVLALTAIPLAAGALVAGLLIQRPPACSGARFGHAGLYCEIAPSSGPPPAHRSFTDRRRSE